MTVHKPHRLRFREVKSGGISATQPQQAIGERRLFGVLDEEEINRVLSLFLRIASNSPYNWQAMKAIAVIWILIGALPQSRSETPSRRSEFR